MDKIAGCETDLIAIDPLQEAAVYMCGTGIVDVNDKMGHAYVMLVYDDAIAKIVRRLAQEKWELDRQVVEKIEKVADDEELVLA